MEAATMSSNNGSGVSGAMIGSGFVLGDSAPSQQILSALEQRINDEAEPIAEKAMHDLERVVCGELEKMGIKWQHTSLTQFSASIKKQYAARLKAERIKAIVDGLVSTPTKGEEVVGAPIAKTCFSHSGTLTPLQRTEINRILNPIAQPTPHR